MWPTADDWAAVTGGRRRGVGAAVARAALRAASLPYGLAVGARNLAFDRGWKAAHRAGVPVVSVGNLTVGGTGKTPAVEWVARFYRECGRRVVVLSRGYGAAAAGPNDEALVLEDNLPDVPHLQGADRVALAAAAVDELDPEVLVLDDGFQHRRLARDLDVVLCDATRPAHRDRLFPRGGLREPVGGLRRAGLVVLTRADQAGPAAVAEQRQWLHRKFRSLPVATACHAAVELIGADDRIGVDELNGRSVGAVCGIGHPDAFRRTLADLGADVAGFRTFPDHHPYTRADVDDLSRWAAALPADAWVAVTQKDWVKLRTPDLGGRPVRAVRVGLRFLDGEDVVRAKLAAVAGATDNGGSA